MPSHSPLGITTQWLQQLLLAEWAVQSGVYIFTAVSSVMKCSACYGTLNRVQTKDIQWSQRMNQQCKWIKGTPGKCPGNSPIQSKHCSWEIQLSAGFWNIIASGRKSQISWKNNNKALRAHPHENTILRPASGTVDAFNICLVMQGILIKWAFAKRRRRKREYWREVYQVDKSTGSELYNSSTKAFTHLSQYLYIFHY